MIACEMNFIIQALAWYHMIHVFNYLINRHRIVRSAVDLIEYDRSKRGPPTKPRFMIMH